MQDIIYSGGGIGQMLLLAIMLISGYYFVKVNTTYKLPLPIKVLNVFIGVMSVYGVMLMFDPTPLYFDFEFTQSVAKLEFLKSLYISLLPIYAMFDFAKQRLLTEESMRGLSIVLIIFTTILYFHEQDLMLQKAMELGSSQEEFTNNTSYKFLHIFPLLFFWRRRTVIQFLLMGYIFTFIVMGLKRGAISIGVVCMLWFMYRMLVLSSRKTRLIIFALTILLIVLGSYYIADFYASSDYFQYRLENTLEGNSSNRDVFYATLVEYFINQDSLTNILFGNGAMTTIMIVGNFAHNDWLELAICQGVLGLVIYFVYFISLFVFFRKTLHNPLVYNIIGMVLMIMFASSLFSMSYNALSISLTLCLGYCFVQYNQQNNE